MRYLLVLLLAACRIPPADTPTDVEPVLTTPALISVNWACDAANERWQLDASASSWTGGATLWLSNDGAYIEAHTVPSVRIEPDGSKDDLQLKLRMEPDWRAVTPGSSTAFTCLEPPDGLLVLRGRRGEQTDCALLGDGLVHPDLPHCTQPFEDVQEP